MIEVFINGQKRLLTEAEYYAIQNDPKKKLIEVDDQLRVLEKMNG